jgi:rod shape-determining protein MreC
MRYDYNYINNKKDKKKKIIFIFVILICIIIVSSFVFRSSDNVIVKNISNFITSPFVNISNFLNSTIKDISVNFSNVNNINYKLEEQQKVNKDLEYKLLEQQKVVDENETLKEMLKISNTFQHYTLKYGKIVIRNHDNFNQTFIINIGSNDGIKLNQAVIHTKGLVGYISNVSENTSTVTTILDPKTSVSVTISTINEPAVLKGNLELKANNSLKLEYIPIDAELSVSDMLYSSGLGSIFPASLPVGSVVNIVNKKNDSDRYAIVEPCVNIKAISEVAVIIG